MLCYRCGTHVPDTSEKCPTCGQNLSTGGLRQATGTFSRRRVQTSQIEGAPHKPQDLVANRYLVKDIVGAGPLGFVFRAHDKELDVEIALKVINHRLLQSVDERKQFAKQLRLARRLSHPNLVRIYEEGEDSERPFFTSQFLDGLTLRKIIDLRLQKGQFFSLGEIEPILSQICAALDGAHKVGPHSNLKPDNVLVLPDLLKVTDFGLGLAMPRLPFTQAMKARKADRYLAPELVAGNEIDGRADIYSVGVILGEMLSGLTPDGAIPELQRRNPEVPPQLEGIYRKALSSSPNARFKTSGDMMTEIAELARELAPPPKVARPEPASGAAPAPRPRTTGMLQFSPRRENKPPPPVPDLPPPPPPLSGEALMPDSTQKVDPAQLERALKNANDLDFKKDRESTQVIDSGMFIAQLDQEDRLETGAMVDTVAPPPQLALPVSQPQERRPNHTWLLVALLVVAGVGVGAGGGFLLIQRQRTQLQQQHLDPTPNPTRVVEPTPEQKATKFAAVAAAAAEKEKERLAAAAAAAQKGADDKAAEAKAEADRLAAERADNQNTAAKTEADRRAKEAKEAAAKEKAEKLAADKRAWEAAAKEKAEKLAADKQAREEAAAKENAEKLAAERKEKGESEKLPEKLLISAVTPPTPVAGMACPEGMRLVGAGAFKMGTAAGDPMMGFDEKALSSVEVGAYCVDIFEYPNKRGVAPTASVGFADAKRLCEAQGKRLCTEAEWEKACKGPGGAKWSYGNSFDANTCNTEDDIGDSRSLSPNGRFAKCRSGYGVADLSGNVAEWTVDRMIKGGSFASGDYAVRCSARKNGASFAKSSEVGFRCCTEQR